MYSVVIPCYKSSQTICNVVERTVEEFRKLGIEEYEFVLANDCSPDEGNTINALRKLASENEYVKVIDLGKNMGQHNAVMACLNYTSGDYIIAMDDDMQTDPSQIHRLMDKLNEGYDLVYGYYEKKKESLFRRFGSFLNFHTVRLLIGKPKWLKTSSFWIMRKYVRDNAIEHKNPAVHLQGVFLSITDNIACVPIEHHKREVGKSTYTLKKLLCLYGNILNYSTFPSRIIMWVGCILFFLGLVLSIFFTVMHFKTPETTGLGELIISFVAMFDGLILLAIGFVARKIDSISSKTSNKPQYIVKDLYNLGDKLK